MSKTTQTFSTRTLIAISVFGALIVAGLLYGVTGSFFSLEGLFIVVGGSVVNAFMSYERDDVYRAFATIRDMFKKVKAVPDRLHKDIMQLIEWAYLVQARDFIGLEQASKKRVSDPLLRYGLDLVVTGYAPDKIREMLQTVSDAEFERRSVPVTVLRNMAATAPAFGMVGTLVGMVLIFKNLGTDINTIGGGLALAMLATLYGILAARMICLPAADKLLQKEEKIRYRNYMLTEGVAMLAEKQNPFYVQDRLNSFLEPTKHFDINDYSQIQFHRKAAMAV